MPPLPGGGKHNPSNVLEEAYWGGELVQRTAAGSGGVLGMWGTAGGRINVESSDDSTWESGGVKTPVDNPDRGQVPGIPDVLSRKGGTAEMLHGGVPRETGDEDGHAGALRAPTCTRNRGDAEGRKLPPPMVRHVRHAGPPEGAEWAPPGHRAVCKMGGEKETEAG